MFAEIWMNAFANIYIVIFISLMMLAILLPKRIPTKALAAALIFGLTVSVLHLLSRPSELQTKSNAELKTRFEKAKDRFEKLCKDRAELKILHTAIGVNGVRLMNVPSGDVPENYWDRDWPDAAMAGELPSDAFIASFLARGVRNADGSFSGNYTSIFTGELPGYKFVDVLQSDGWYKRYTLDLTEKKIVSTEKLLSPNDQRLPKYSIEFDNKIDMDAREDWIAGSEIIIRNLSNGDVMAVFRRYVWHPGLGNKSNPATPWLIAQYNQNSCPNIGSSSFGGQVRFFASKVLKENEGD